VTHESFLQQHANRKLVTVRSRRMTRPEVITQHLIRFNPLAQISNTQNPKGSFILFLMLIAYHSILPSSALGR